MKNTNKKGFTLVELVIVIAVIAILAAVLIPTFTSVINRANQSAALQKIKAQVDEAYVEYVADNHEVPTTFYLEDDGKTVVFGMPTVDETVYYTLAKNASKSLYLGSDGSQVYLVWNEGGYSITTVPAESTFASETYVTPTP